jgi:hypothetical protein
VSLQRRHKTQSALGVLKVAQVDGDYFEELS